jgi:EAL domain-containing protein (putative c-di-GMP-specific phosphodiesterase class I)
VAVQAPDPVTLETDWLRLKSHLFDPATGLPTLAAVLEDVRRLLARQPALALVYLDVGGGIRLEARHGWQDYDETVRIAASALAAPRPGVPRADVVSVMGARCDKFVLFFGAAGGETLDAATAETRAAALRDFVAEALAAEGRREQAPLLMGLALVHSDPMLRAERAVHRALDEAMFRSLRRRSVEEEQQARWLDSLIERESVVTVFQPVVDLRDLSVVGQEAFTHGPEGGRVREAEALFLLAERTGRAIAFERLCRRQAFRRFGGLANGGPTLFLKASPAALNDPDFTSDGLVRELSGTGLAPADVVVEVQERLAALDRKAFRAALRALKAHGFRIAIDDMGAGYSSLQSIAEMEPDFLKFDMALVRNLDQSPIKRSLLETVVRVSKSADAPVVACGIETAAELATIRDMGVPLGQGHYLVSETTVPPASGDR